MSLKTVVKVSHLSNLSDARYCAGMGVDLLGFRAIEGDPNYMPAAVFQDIRGWIAGPGIVAEIYGVQSEEEIMRIKETYAPDYFELTQEEYAKFGHFLPLPCIVTLTSNQPLVQPQGNADVAWLIASEEKHVEAGKTSGVPILFSLKDAAEVDDALNAGYNGIVIPGPHEGRPGITNTDALADILEALEED